MLARTTGLAVVGAMLFLVTSADAQNKQKPQAVRISGEVKGYRSGVLLVVGSDTKAYYVRFDREAKIDITGDTDASILKVGMYVRFEVKMDKRGNAEEAIDKLELFTYDAQVARTGTEERGDGKYLVAGRIKSLTKAGKMTVSVDKSNTVTGDVAKGAPVNVGVRGAAWLQLAKPGDTVSLFGDLVRPPSSAPGAILAKEVQVTMSKAAAPAADPKTAKEKKKS